MRFLIPFLLLFGWVQPGAAAALTIEQQSAWALKTATTATITKDHFCANEAVFNRGYHLAIARNLIGQSSLVITMPDARLAPGTTMPVRVALDGKPMRDAQGQARSQTILVIPFGWDEDLTGALSVAKRIGITTSDLSLAFSIYDNGEAMSRLASCTASLLERAPDGSGLSSDVSWTLRQAGLSQQAHLVQVGLDVPKSTAETYVINGIYGGSDIVKGDDAQTAMLDYIDRLELLCKSKFDSTLGAAGEGRHPVVTADATCKNGPTGAMTALIFTGNGDDSRVYYFESDVQRREQITKLRDRLAQALQ